jgi:hypothetical protein
MTSELADVAPGLALQAVEAEPANEAAWTALEEAMAEFADPGTLDSLEEWAAADPPHARLALLAAERLARRCSNWNDADVMRLRVIAGKPTPEADGQ